MWCGSVNQDDKFQAIQSDVNKNGLGINLIFEATKTRWKWTKVSNSKRKLDHNLLTHIG